MQLQCYSIVVFICSSLIVNKTTSLSCLCHFVRQLSVTITNAQDNQLIKREGLFWVMVSEVPGHHPLAMVLLGLW
jgi:hypothetical protein